MAIRYCVHGESFSFDSEEEAAGISICAYCCTPYARGEYRAHCASSPSHRDELAARAKDRQLSRFARDYPSPQRRLAD
jgi:hypothetical protein